MSNEFFPFLVTNKVVCPNGATFSFGNSNEDKGYCVCIHTEYEKIYFFRLQDEYEVIDLMEGSLSDLFGKSDSFQRFKDIVMREVLFINKIKLQNEQANEMKFIGKVNPNAKGNQFLWRKGNKYVVTSWANPPMDGRTEILGFKSNSQGTVEYWLELDALYSVADTIDNHKFVAEKSFRNLK